MDYCFFVKKKPPIWWFLECDMWEDDKWFFSYCWLAYVTIISHHICFYLFFVFFMEVNERFWFYNCSLYSDIDRCEESVCSIFEYKCYFWTWFLSIKSDIMCFCKFSFEFEKEKIFYHSLLHCSMIVAISKNCIHIREITEVEFYMSRKLCFIIKYEWSDSLNDIIFERKFCIFVYFSPRESYIFCGTISLKYITYSHSDGTKIFHIVIFFFCEKFLSCYLKYIHEIFCYSFWIFDIFLPLTEVDIFISDSIDGFDFCLGFHDFLYLYLFSLWLCIFSKSDTRKRKRCHFIISHLLLTYDYSSWFVLIWFYNCPNMRNLWKRRSIKKNSISLVVFVDYFTCAILVELYFCCIWRGKYISRFEKFDKILSLPNWARRDIYIPRRTRDECFLELFDEFTSRKYHKKSYLPWL